MKATGTAKTSTAAARTAIVTIESQGRPDSAEGLSAGSTWMSLGESGTAVYFTSLSAGLRLSAGTTPWHLMQNAPS